MYHTQELAVERLDMTMAHRVGLGSAWKIDNTNLIAGLGVGTRIILVNHRRLKCIYRLDADAIHLFFLTMMSEG